MAGAGLSPKAPGTIGTLAAIPVYLVLPKSEMVGYLITMLALPLNPILIIVGFILFRLFDILKPWPIGWVDRHVHGGLGIMLDDVIAGVMAAVVLQLGWRLLM